MSSRLGLLSAVCTLVLGFAMPAAAHHRANHGPAGGGEASGADLRVALADSPDPVAGGQLLTYTATVANDGPGKATGVSVTDALPSSVTFVSASGNRGASCTESGSTVTCQISRLNSGASSTLSIAVRPTAPGTVANRVSADADQADPDTQDNQASTSTTVVDAPPPDPDPDPGACSGHAWFVGIVYDEEEREDFAADIEHFQRFSDQLRATHCIPAGQSTILDFQSGSEANLKAELRRVASAANQYPDSQLFFFLSSHGNASSGALSAVGASACPPTRLVGSFAALKEGGGEDGFLDDCELGAELSRFAPATRMFVAVDCSFCGGFSDSLTAASGTVPDGGVPTSSGVPAPNRVVVTGCAVTTECFGSRDGGNLYRHLNDVLSAGTAACDGWTAPGFSQFQGANLPVRGSTDGRCTSSEWFFAAVQRAYTAVGQIGNPEHHVDHALSVQQQFRIKYGFDSLAEDLLIR